MINILFSGIDKENGFNDKQIDCIKRYVKNCSNIVLISSIFNNYNRNDEQLNKIIKYFSNIGIRFNNAMVIDNRIDKSDIESIMKDVDIVFLIGDSPFLQMKSIMEYKLDNYIKKSPIVIGVSAGSMNQSKRIIYKDEYEGNKILEYEGIGFVDVNIYPHLDFNNIEHLKEIFEISKKTPLVLLPNESFIIVKNKNVEYIGEHYFVNENTMDIPKAYNELINHIGTIDLESKRLLYRKTNVDDIDEFFYIQLNPKLRKYLGLTKIGSNPEKNREYFDSSKYNDLNFYRWTIVRKEDNKLLGCIYLNIHSEKAKTAGIDYWIREDAWGNGYATEASKCILDFAFEKLDLNRIESCGAKDNPGTWKVMEKIGLKYEGTRKQGQFYYYGGIQDLVMYGLTKEEYIKEKNSKNLIENNK